MKTVSEAAKELNVTSQAIYQRIRNKTIDGLADHIHKDGGTTVLDDKAIELLKAAMLGEQRAPESPQDKPESSETVEAYKETVNLLKEQMDLLKEQLDIKDRQISDLNERLKEVNSINGSNQVLLAAKMGLMDKIKYLIGK